MPESKVTIEEERKIRITWQRCIAIIQGNKLDMLYIDPQNSEGGMVADIPKDPEGFVEFAVAIRETLLANKPPEPPKPRKVRSDKGIPKKKKKEVI